MPCVIEGLTNMSICVFVSLVSPYCIDAEDANCDDPFIPRRGQSGTTSRSVSEHYHSNTNNGQQF